MVFLQNSEEAGRLTLSRQLLNIVSRLIVSVVLYDIYTPVGRDSVLCADRLFLDAYNDRAVSSASYTTVLRF